MLQSAMCIQHMCIRLVACACTCQSSPPFVNCTTPAYVPYDYIANSDFNFLGQYAIKGLTNYDLTPDDDDGSDPFDAPPDDDGGLDEWQEEV